MITLNGNQPPQQPGILNENPEKIKTDTHAIDGSVERHQFPSKGHVVFVIPMATLETYQFFKALYDAASPVTYSNDESNEPGGTLTFTGILDFEAGDYIRGGSLLVPLTITIREQ